jgi:hypothetical protein
VTLFGLGIYPKRTLKKNQLQPMMKTFSVRAFSVRVGGIIADKVASRGDPALHCFFSTHAEITIFSPP